MCAPSTSHPIARMMLALVGTPLGSRESSVSTTMSAGWYPNLSAGRVQLIFVRNGDSGLTAEELLDVEGVVDAACQLARLAKIVDPDLEPE